MSEHGLVALAAAIAAGVALAVPDRRRRAVAMLVAGVLAALALALLVEGDSLGSLVGRPLVLAAALVGAVALAALTELVRRRPGALALLVVAAVPFRVPVPTGEDTANLLVPLYGVIAAGCLAYALSWLRGGADADAETRASDDGRTRLLRLGLAAALVLYGVQALYSTDVDQAVENLAFFYVPFALLFLLLVEVPWTAKVLRGAFGVAVGLAVLCAAVGIVEFATGHLLISNAKVLEANELKPYFRVNSLFFDPNIYGRFLAVAMIALAAVLLWSHRTRTALLVAGTLVLLWGGLVLSLSQSSFGALLAGLAVLAAVRWRALPVVAVGAVAALAVVVVVVAAPDAVGVEKGRENALDRATSGRVELVEGALRMIADRPVFGFGSGSFAERYRAREKVRSEQAAAISHTTPLTIAAEQGVVGLIAYLVVLAAALVVLFRGLLAALRGAAADRRALARLAVAAAFCGLVLHTYAYAAFLEDPLTWVLLAIGAALSATAPPPARAPVAAA